MIKTNGLLKKFKNVTNVAEQQNIYARERSRLKIDDEIPNEAIGLKAICEGSNLATLV